MRFPIPAFRKSFLHNGVTSRYPANLEIQFALLDSHSLDEILPLIFSHLSPGATVDKGSLSGQTKKLSGIYSVLDLGIWFLSSYFSFPTYPALIGATSQSHILISLTKMFESIIYMVLRFLLLYKCLVRISNDDILCISIGQIMP